MENRIKFYNLRPRKDGGKPIENLPVDGKRKNPFDVRPIQAVKQTNPKVFHSSYQKPHTRVITSSDLAPVNCNLIEEDNEEYSLTLTPYTKQFSFHAYSYIEASNKVERLLNTLENRHKALKPSKRSSRQRKEGPQLSDLDKTNAKLELSLLYGQNIYKASVMSKIFNVKSGQINYVKRKEKDSKAPILEVRGRKTIIRSQYLIYIDNYLRNPNNCFTSIREMRFNLLDHFNLNKDQLSVSTVSKMVKSLSFHYKRSKREPIRRNIEDTKQQRYELVLEILKKEDLKKTFVYIDESGFNNYAVPLYGYAKNSEPCLFKVSRRTSNFSVIAAMSENRILGYQIFQGSITASDYATFMIQLIHGEHLQERGLENYVFFLDNAKIHKAKKLKMLNKYLDIFFNAPYSPQLNPIEGLFSVWKSLFRKMRAETEADIIKNIISSCKQITRRTLVGFVKHSVEYYFDCLDKNDIK